MKLLITDGSNEVAETLKNGLGSYDITLSEHAKNNPINDNIIINNLDPSLSTTKFISEFDYVIIQAISSECKTPQDLNSKVQEIYNILSSCVESGIKKVIMINDLDNFKSYQPGLTITENWEPKPEAEIKSLSSHLSEKIFKEFGRTYPFQKILVRASLPFAESNNLKEKYESGISKKVFIESVNTILKSDFSNRYEVLHIQNNLENQRFLTSKFNNISTLTTKEPQIFYEPKLKNKGAVK